jgi:Uncharacterised nucleotidyltransferase
MLPPRQIPLPPEQQEAYRDALAALAAGGLEFLVGGGFGLFLYLAQWRATKDLDVFLRPETVPEAFRRLSAAGFCCELTDAAWLAKARRADAPIDIIFCSYNGLFPVDGQWFARARTAHLLGSTVRVVAPEEMILSKSFVAARDRFDGSDIAWLVRELGATLDWDRIERHMDRHWQVLLWQLVHCLYVFPGTRAVIPRDLLVRLAARFAREVASADGDPRLCLGPMLDPVSYLTALAESGLEDPRPRADLIA